MAWSLAEIERGPGERWTIHVRPPMTPTAAKSEALWLDRERMGVYLRTCRRRSSRRSSISLDRGRCISQVGAQPVAVGTTRKKQPIEGGSGMCSNHLPIRSGSHRIMTGHVRYGSNLNIQQKGWSNRWISKRASSISTTALRSLDIL